MKKIILIIILTFCGSFVEAKTLTKYTYEADDYLLSTERKIVSIGYQTEDAYPVYDFLDENGFYNNLYVSSNYDKIYWATYDKNMKRIDEKTILVPEIYSRSQYKDPNSSYRDIYRNFYYDMSKPFCWRYLC